MYSSSFAYRDFNLTEIRPEDADHSEAGIVTIHPDILPISLVPSQTWFPLIVYGLGWNLASRVERPNASSVSRVCDQNLFGLSQASNEGEKEHTTITV